LLMLLGLGRPLAVVCHVDVTRICINACSMAPPRVELSGACCAPDGRGRPRNAYETPRAERVIEPVTKCLGPA